MGIDAKCVCGLCVRYALVDFGLAQRLAESESELSASQQDDHNSSSCATNKQVKLYTFCFKPFMLSVCL